MKIARFIHESRPEIGIVGEDGVRSLTKVVPQLAPTMRSLIENWHSAQSEVPSLLASADAVPLDSVRLLAPIEPPATMLAIGLNYMDHIRETGLEVPKTQVWFGKLPGALNDPFGDVEIPLASDQVDYEVELVAVIGSGGRNLSAKGAPDAIFGYCVGNDVSVRDWQTDTPQWLLGKSFETHAPVGPWITTADEVGDPHRLEISCFVNGERRQHSNTRHLVFNLWQQIEHLSKAVRLRPGDLIFTGTPSGVGWAMSPRQLLKEGDRVRCSIEALGEIESRFVRAGVEGAR